MRFMKLSAKFTMWQFIVVSDYDKSRDFYVNKLGFEIIRENHRPKRHDYV